MSSGMNEILDYLDEMFPNPKCELIYHKDYELLIAVMLSAQTTDKRVNKVTETLFLKYPTLKDLANASLAEVSRLVYELGNYRKKALATIEIAQILLEQYHGKVPKSRKALEALPMVGRKTCNVVLSEIYEIPNIAVDTHVFRVSKRLSLAKENDDVLKVEEKLKRKIPRDRWSKVHHQLVLFGRYHCKAIAPDCSHCKLQKMCRFSKE